MDEFGLREQLNRIQQLLDQAEEQGYLTADQIRETLPTGRDDVTALTAQLECLFATLYDREIEVKALGKLRHPRHVRRLRGYLG
jgi:hypothetical protein